MQNIKLLISYDGTNYSGWQIQPDKTTIQGEITDKLQLILQHNIKLTGASRTDAGVHAKSQVANFFTTNRYSCMEIKKRLNKLLPDDIKIISAENVNESFNARKYAKYKIYKYYIQYSEIPYPFYRNYSWFISNSHQINVKALNKLSEQLIGKKNFFSFSGQKSESKTFERTVYNAFWEKRNNFLIFTIEGEGFLKNMVRKIVGSLIAISLKKENNEYLQYLFAIKDRKEGKYCAPPQGLFLEKIFF